MRDCHVVLHSDCTILHSHQQGTKVPVFPNIFFFLFSFFYNGPPNVCEVVPYCGLDCISLMISNIDFMCLLVIWISSMEKCLFKSFAHYFNWVIFLFICFWVVGVLYIFWILVLYQIYILQIFSSILLVAILLFILSFDAQKF